MPLFQTASAETSAKFPAQTRDFPCIFPVIREIPAETGLVVTVTTARANGEVVGTCRLRWFARFAKIERVAVLPRCRGQGVARDLIDAAKSMAAGKGYERMLAHVEPTLSQYWREQGFAPRIKRSSFRFSDRRYVEVLAELRPDAKAIDLDTAPLVTVRPEGKWDEDGVLDRSARRAIA